MSELTRRIKVARKQAKMTQENLGKAIGLTKKEFAAIENNKRPISVDELVKLIEFLKLDLGFFTDTFRLVGEGKFSFRVHDQPDSLPHWKIRVK